jgi:hypothetical protein
VFVVTARRVFNHMKIIDLGTCKTEFPFLVLFVWLILSLPSQAQVAGASLSGTVTDASGAAVAGAKVTIENLATGVSRDPTTDKDGFYTAPNLLPGTHGITVSAAGFATQVRKGLTVSVGRTVDRKLSPCPHLAEHTEHQNRGGQLRILSTWFSRITCCTCQSLRTRKQPKDTHGIETVRSRGARHLQ